MRDLRRLNAALDAHGYLNGNEPLDVYAQRAIKQAAIALLKSASDPEAIFIGALLTDTLRIFRPETYMMEVKIQGSQLTIDSNLRWVAYLNSLGNAFLIRELRHNLMHLILAHPENIKMHSEGLDNCLANLAMDICINEYISAIPAFASAQPLCPECLLKYKAGNKNKPLPEPNMIGDKSCSICFGVGALRNDFRAIKIINEQHKGRAISRPYEFNVANYRATQSALRNMEKAALDAKNSPSVYDLVDALVPYDSAYEKSVAQSIMNHAYSQSQSYDLNGESGGLLDIFKDLRKEKKVPYLMRLRGVLGASMKDEGEPTRYRPNRRFGYEYPGTKAIPKQRYVFAIDTSGSVPLDEVKKVINEFLNISAYSDKIECRVIFFHHGVYYDKEIKDYSEKDLKALQSGGTNFDNVFEAVFGKSDKKERGPAVLVMHTDGYCSISFSKSKINGGVHWLITKDGSSSYVKDWDRNAEIIRID